MADASDAMATDALEGISDGVRNVNKEEVPGNEIQVGAVDGTQLIPNQSSTLPLTVLVFRYRGDTSTDSKRGS
jgi:hypothetical protein